MPDKSKWKWRLGSWAIASLWLPPALLVALLLWGLIEGFLGHQ